jgi:hypothetical protein
LPEHCVAPGTQTPTHDPPTHAESEQAAGVPHVPFDWHVATPLPEHSRAPGVQEPVHVPETHA